MHNHLYLLLFFFCSLSFYAQENSASPYSFYGLGENKFKGAQENRAMGGVAVFRDSLHLNFQNPASYSFLNRTAFTVGMNQNRTSQATENSSGEVRRTYFDYMALGIPIGKFGASIGLMPYTSVGYKLFNVSTDEQGSQRSRIFNGRGGTSRVFGAVGYQVNKNLSFGMDFGYIFGDVQTRSVEYITGVQYGTRELTNSDISGAEINLGAMYNKKITERYTLFASATFKPESNFNISNLSTVSTVQSGGSIDLEIPVDELETRNEKRTIKNPTRFTLGAGFGDVNKFVIGTEFTFTQNDAFGNRLLDIENTDFENGLKIGLGGYYIPKYNSFSSYWSRVVYRGGMFYEKSGIIINDEDINNYGITFGLSLPVTGSLSSLNVGCELGSRGTKNANLVKENYINIMISLSLNDKWFVKSKYY